MYKFSLRLEAFEASPPGCSKSTGSSEMEGKSRRPEITVVPAAADGGGAAVDAVKAASKEPISPGSPSPASGAVVGRGKESLSRHEAAVVSLPAWKLDALCQESGPSPAVMRARFPYF